MIHAFCSVHALLSSVMPSHKVDKVARIDLNQSADVLMRYEG
jgi:hypothetical protein